MRTPFFAAGGIAAAGGVIALLLAILATSGVSTVVSTAESEKTAADQRQSAVNALEPQEEPLHKAYSFKNVVEGVIATIQPPKTEDADEDDPAPPPRNLTFRADLLPGLIAKVTHDTLVEYSNSGPRTPVFYANYPKGTPEAGGPLSNNASSLHVNMTTGWEGMDGGTGGYFVADREFQYGVWIASELNSSVSQEDAFNILKTRLADADEGLLVTRLREAILAQLVASGEITEDEVKSVNFNNSLVVEVTNISNTQYGPDQLTLSNIVSTNGVQVLKDNRAVRAPRERNDVKIGVSGVSVRVTLSAVKPQMAEEEETTE